MSDELRINIENNIKQHLTTDLKKYETIYQKAIQLHSDEMMDDEWSSQLIQAVGVMDDSSE